MVRTYQSPVRVYKYPFELVMQAYERRFPSCELIPVFEGSDIIDEEHSEDGAEHIVTRRCKLNVDAPYLLKKIAGVDYFYCLQKNMLDLRARTLKIEAWNESFSTRIVIQEYCTYSVHPENPDWTCFEQSASLEVKSFFGFENAVEKLAAKHYASSIEKGREVIEHFIEELRKEGVTSVSIFDNKSGKSSKSIKSIDENGPTESEVSSEQSESDENASLDKNEAMIVVDQVSESIDQKLTIAAKSEEVTKNKSQQLERSDSNVAIKVTTGNVTKKAELKHQHSLSTEAGFPSDNANLKLESEYIAKCIGEMTPYQESCLVQLKKRMLETHSQTIQANGSATNKMSMKKKIPSDQTLMRFLKAQDFNLDKAREMLSASLLWRKKHQVDKILSTYQVPEVVQKYFPGCWLNKHDKDGRPIFMLNVGQMDLKGFVKSIGQEGLVKLTLHICEQGLKKVEEATKSFGKPITSWTLLLDLDGLNTRHFWRPGLRTCFHIIEMVEANYPETLGRVIMTRAPRIFPIMWTILSTFINENTHRKFVFLADQQDLKLLEQFIDCKSIPKLLGGEMITAPALLNGGLIPKSHYVIDDLTTDSSHLLDNTMYTSVSLVRGQSHEVLFDAKESQTVICWDFDIIKQDVQFSVLRLNTSLPKLVSNDENGNRDSNSNMNTVSPSQSKGDKEQLTTEHEHTNLDECTDSKNLQTRSSGDANSGLIIPKSWQINKDFVTVEPVLTCHDGDSIQGSHITSAPGKYVLQWKHVEPTASHHTFSSHKAKIMYYCEVLKSKDFRGSMTSLQSSHSGTTLASGLSLHGSCPSR